MRDLRLATPAIAAVFFNSLQRAGGQMNHWVSRERLSREALIGTFLGIGSPISAEIAGKAGFDWVLIDTEHGVGDFAMLVQQLQALSGSATAAACSRRLE